MRGKKTATSSGRNLYSELTILFDNNHTNIFLDCNLFVTMFDAYEVGKNEKRLHP